MLSRPRRPRRCRLPDRSPRPRPLGCARARIVGSHRSRRRGGRGARVTREWRRDRGRRRRAAECAPGRHLPRGRHRDDQRLPAAPRRDADPRQDEHSSRHAGDRAAPLRDRCVQAAGAVGGLSRRHRAPDRMAGRLEPARHRLRGLHALRASRRRSAQSLDRVRAGASRPPRPQGHPLRAGTAGVQISRLLSRRRRHPAATVRRAWVSAPNRRRAARVVPALLRDRAAAAPEHGGAVCARAPPLRGPAARERLGPLLHLTPLRHPRFQPVRYDDIQPRGGARCATRLRLVHEPGRPVDLLARRRGGKPRPGRHLAGGPAEHVRSPLHLARGNHGLGQSARVPRSDRPADRHGAQRTATGAHADLPLHDVLGDAGPVRPRSRGVRAAGRCDHRVAGRQRRPHARASDRSRTLEARRLLSPGVPRRQSQQADHAHRGSRHDRERVPEDRAGWGDGVHARQRLGTEGLRHGRAPDRRHHVERARRLCRARSRGAIRRLVDARVFLSRCGERTGGVRPLPRPARHARQAVVRLGRGAASRRTTVAPSDRPAVRGVQP